MTVKWQPTHQCPHGCDKFFGSTVALNWHLEEHHGAIDAAESDVK